MTAEDDDHFWTEGNTGQSAHQIWSIVMNYDSFPFSKILTSGLQTQCIKKVLGQRRDLASNCVLLLASCVTVSLHSGSCCHTETSDLEYILNRKKINISLFSVIKKMTNNSNERRKQISVAGI